MEDTYYSKNAISVYQNLYLAYDKDGNQIENIDQCHDRVANFLADTLKEKEIFKHLLDDQIFRINTPAMVNAGIEDNPNLAACFIIGLSDDMESIKEMWNTAATIYEGGGGCGIPITNLREKDALISSGGRASGPLGYMPVIQTISDQVKSGGKQRRAANLLSFDYNHPDAFEIAKCKDDKQSFTAMNLSMLVDNTFMQLIDSEKNEMPRYSPKDKSVKHSYFYPQQLWNTIIEQAWKGGDPGLLFYDRINEDNPTPSLGEIKTSNPCGEIPGLPWTVCDLGHWNLNKFMFNHHFGKVDFDWEKLDEYIYWGVLLLNRIIDKTVFPNQKFQDMMQKLRPIGMGFMGFADILYKMRIPYGSKKAQELVEDIQKFITQKAFESSKLLAEQNICPKTHIPSEDATNFTKFLEKFNIPSTFVISNTQVTTCAPTGSTAISADCSYGFEPHMALVWDKQLADSGQVMHFFNDQFREECNQQGIKLTDELIDKIKKNKGSIQGINEFPKSVQEIFVTAHDIDWKSRIDMQAAAQKWITMSISSTINLPNSATKEDVGEVYKYAWQRRLKGITIFRDGCLDDALQSQPVNFGGEKTTKRERPKTLNGNTHKLKTGSGTLYLTINEWGNEPFEVFATVGKSGRSIAAKAESLGRMVSLALRSGISIKEIVRQLEGIGGDYQLFQEGKLIKSIPDGIAHILKDEYLSKEYQEQASQLAKEIGAQSDSVDSASICPKCGQPTLRMDGSCRGGQCMNPECMFSNCS